MSIQEWNGRPVPWIARWTHEVIKEIPGVNSDGKKIYLTFADGKDDRDKYGFLWQREGILRGGEPQFAQVSTYRQRAAMRHRLCQVCGTKIPEGRIRWMFGPGQLQQMGDGTYATLSAPTCDSCVDFAATNCPHLKSQGHEIALVDEYTVWGVYGNVLTVRADQSVDIQGQTAIPYGADLPPHMAVYAQQLVVRLTKFSLEGP